MKRKLILIFNDGGPGNYLPGVKIDKENYFNFLTSPEGGAWRNDEIMIYHNNCTKGALECYIKTYKCDRNKPDYWLLIFCGHGYTNCNNKTILELSPGHECFIEDIKNSLDNSLCLFIVDCCRVSIHRIAESHIKKANFFSYQNQTDDYIEKCRKLYNDELEKVSQNRFNIIYSTSINQCAQEDDMNGGYYSHELLSISDERIRQCKIRQRKSDSILYIQELHDDVRSKVIEKSDNIQIPTCEGVSLGEIPFIVVPM